MAGSKAADHSADDKDHDITQEDKPRSRILAEYLAHGYVISDTAIQRAISLDNKHGLSNRFTSALSNFDSKYKASDKARSVDESYGITAKASGALTGLDSYFEKAMGTPTGQRVRQFYTQGDKQVREVHAEARRLADMKAGKNSTVPVPGTEGEKTTCNCGSEVRRHNIQRDVLNATELTASVQAAGCPCPPGKCACANCEKSDVKEISSNPKQTTCGCGGEEGVCGCAPNECRCSSCPKNEEVSEKSTATT